jgi:hypothetical protein
MSSIRPYVYLDALKKDWPRCIITIMEEYWYRFVHGPYQDVVISRDGRVLDTDAHGTVRAKAACYAWNGPPQPGLSGDVVHKNGDTNDCSFENVVGKVRWLRSNDKTHQRQSAGQQDPELTPSPRSVPPGWFVGSRITQASCTDTRTSARWHRRYCGESRCTVFTKVR